MDKQTELAAEERVSVPLESEDAVLPPAEPGVQPERPAKPVFTSQTIPFVHEEEVRDRQQELTYLLDSITKQIEQTGEQLNESIETLLQIDAGLTGFALKAFRGTRVPPGHGRKIDALTDKLEALEERYSLIQECISLSKELLQRAARAADIENKRMLRWRAQLVLEIKFDETKLLAAEQELQSALHALSSEQPEVKPEKPRKLTAGSAEAAPEKSPSSQNDLLKKLLTKRRPAG